MKRFFTATTVLALALFAVGDAQAGPFGLFGNRCNGGSSANGVQRTGPIRTIIRSIRENHPIRSALANGLHRTATAIESRPIATVIRSAFNPYQSCQTCQAGSSAVGSPSVSTLAYPAGDLPFDLFGSSCPGGVCR